MELSIEIADKVTKLNALYLDTKDKNRYFYKIEENKIVQLSQEGLPIEGNLADIYVLKKK